MINTFSWPVRVYWEDTDAGGIVSREMNTEPNE